METAEQKAYQGSEAVLDLSGLSRSQKQGYRPAGNSTYGDAIFTSAQLARSDDVTAGAKLLHTLYAYVAPFHVTGKAEQTALDNFSKASSDKKLIKRLDDFLEKRDQVGFTNAFLSSVNSSASDLLGRFCAMKAYSLWGLMSPAQKSLAIATAGVQTYKTSKGTHICDLKIIDGKGQEFKVRDALSMSKEGKNPYTLVMYWDQIYKLSKVFHVEHSPESMTDFASSHNLLGSSIKGSAVPGVGPEQLNAADAKPAPQYGVGAVIKPSDSSTPNGYNKAVSSGNDDVVVPQPNTPSAEGAVSGSLVGSQAGNQGMSTGSVGVYKSWKKPDAKLENKGAFGGSHFVAALGALRTSNPYLFSALVAFLAEKVSTPLPTKELNAYVASLAGVALSVLLTGKRERQAESEGVKLAGNAGNSAADFAKLQVNLRALYASFGVSSRADAYQLSNQAFAEDRINESDIIAMHTVFDIVYSNDGKALAQKLLTGKDRGLEIAREHETPAYNSMLDYHGRTRSHPTAPISKEAVRLKNLEKYQGLQ